MTIDHMPAVRAARVLLARLSERYSVAIEADRAICPDGYGTETLYDNYNTEMMGVLDKVAPRFGITTMVLLHSIEHEAHEQTFRSFHPTVRN